MKTKPSTQYLLLGALISGPKHGYEIMQFIEEVLESTWVVGTSQLYALLKRLEQQHLLHSNVENQKKRPAKRIFSITGDGKRTFLTWLNSPIRHVRDFRIEFLAKIFFFYHLSIRGGPELIDLQIELFKGIRKRMRQRLNTEKDPYAKFVYGFKLTTVEARLKWLMNKAAPFVAEIDPGVAKGKAAEVGKWSQAGNSERSI